MFKETPLLSAITVLELMNEARSIANYNYRYVEPMTMVGVFFLAVSIPSVIVAALDGAPVRPDRRETAMAMSATATDRPRVALDDRPVARRIGLVLLSTDHTSERDFGRIVPASEAAVYCNRIAFENPTTPETAAGDGAGLAEGAGADPARRAARRDLLFLHRRVRGAWRRRGRRGASRRASPGVPVVTPPMAARKALAALGVRSASASSPPISTRPPRRSPPISPAMASPSTG